MVGAASGKTNPRPRPFLARFAGPAAAVLTANLVSMACAAALLPLLTRKLTPAEYALVAGVMAAALYLSVVIADPITMAFQRFAGQYSDRANFLYSRRRLALLIAPVLIVASVSAAATGRWGIAFAVFGWGSGFAAMRFVSNAWLMWLRPWRYTLALTVSTGLRTSIIVIMVLRGDDIFLALGLAGIVSGIIGVALGPRSDGAASQGRPWPAFFGISLLLGTVGTSLLQAADRILLPFIVQPAAAGQYAAMSNVAVLTIGAALVTVRTVAFPVMMRDWAERRRLRSRTTTILALHASLILTAIAVIVIELVGEPVLTRVVGAEYVNLNVVSCLAGTFALLAIGQQAAWIHTVNLAAYRIRNRSIAAALLYVLLLFTLPHLWGIRGAVLACVAAMGAYAIMMLRNTGLGASPAVLGVCWVLACLGVLGLPQELSLITFPLLLLASIVVAAWQPRGIDADLQSNPEPAHARGEG